ncbi:putative reverse transcriptase domain-containing protein [Tanacetum coccineum]
MILSAEEDPEEYEDDETEDGPIDYPMDGGEDGDDDDGDSSGDDAEDEDEDEEEVEEHLAPADSAVVVPTVELVSPPEGTEPVTPPPSTDITTTGARITVRLQASISLPPEAEVERLLAMPTPPPSPLISLSPPSARERLARCTAPSAHSSPPPVPSPLLPSSGCPTQIQTLRIASTQALVDAVTAALPSPPLPPLPPSLYIPPPVDRRDDIPESERPPRKRSCLFALGSRYEVGESSTARPTGGRGIDYGFVSTVDAEARRRGIREVGYGIRDTWVDPAEAVPEIAPMTVGESDPEEDPEEYEDDKTEDCHVDYPMDGGEDRDDDDGNSSGDDADDDNEDDEDEEEVEEHLAPANSAVVVPIVEPVSPPKGTEPVIPPPSTDITTTGARITVRLQASTSLPLEAEVERLLAMPTPPPSPLISLSPPSAGEHLARCTTLSAHSSPPPVPSPLLPSSECPDHQDASRDGNSYI